MKKLMIAMLMVGAMGQVSGVGKNMYHNPLGTLLNAMAKNMSQLTDKELKDIKNFNMHITKKEAQRIEQAVINSLEEQLPKDLQTEGIKHFINAQGQVFGQMMHLMFETIQPILKDSFNNILNAKTKEEKMVAIKALQIKILNKLSSFSL